jgi:hypothetical protein
MVVMMMRYNTNPHLRPSMVVMVVVVVVMSHTDHNLRNFGRFGWG